MSFTKNEGSLIPYSVRPDSVQAFHRSDASRRLALPIIKAHSANGDFYGPSNVGATR